MAKEETPKARKIGQDSNGDPALYPSDIEAVSTQYNLTVPEAERLLLGGKVNDKEADKIKGERVVYRPHFEVVDGAESNPLGAADRRQAEADAEAKTAEKAEPVEDKFSPEAGPYGPNAEYTVVEAPVDTDHTSPRDPEEVKS